MDKNKYLERLKKLQNNYDIEAAHSEADNILCEILMEFELEDILEAYENVPKWYA